MKIQDLQSALKHTPFRPLEIHAGTQTFSVLHPEQVAMTPGKDTLVIVDISGYIHILDVHHVSSLTNKRRVARKAA